MTLFGESAGGHDIKQLLANPPSPLPFRAAIMESQNQLASGNGALSYAQVAKNFGCSTSTSTLACLRKVPATDLQAYITEEGLGFFEVTGDGTSVGKQAITSILSGKFADVPILIGTNAQEATVFVDLLNPDDTSINQTLAANGFDIGISDATAKAMYPSLADAGTTLISQVVTDLAFTCSTQTLSSAIQLSGRSIWRYRYEGDFPNLQLFPNAGAYHTSEIPSVWGTYPLDNQFGAVTQDQIALSKYMQGVWSDFAKNPSAGAPWPKLGSAFGKELGVLGGKKVPAGEETKSLLSSDAPCAVFSPLLIAAGQAY